MKAIFTTLIIVLSISSLTYGQQVTDFDYPSFKTPDTEFKSLSINPSTGFFKSNSTFSEDFQELSLGTSIFYRNTALTRAKNSDFFLFSNLQYSNQEKSSTNSLSLSLSADGTQQYYFRPKRFFEVEYSASGLYITSELDGVELNQRNIYALLSPKIGFGRIENVSNAWHTESILKILAKEGLLKKELSQEEMYLLAEELTVIKNQRVIDFRFDDIYEYETVIRYLVDNAFVDPTDYKFLPYSKTLGDLKILCLENTDLTLRLA